MPPPQGDMTTTIVSIATSMEILSHAIIFFLCISTSKAAMSMSSKFSIIGHDNRSELTAMEEKGLELFEEWMAKYGKVYAHPAEKSRRLENFLNNVRYINEKNAMKVNSSATHLVGLNRFADLSNEEFRVLYVHGMSKNSRKNRIRRTETGRKDGECDAPYSLDWRMIGAVTPVKDQGQCGSCWAFSSTGAMEGINAIVTGELISLSEQELVDCDTTNNGCEGGAMDFAFEWVINNGGMNTEYNYPYTGIDGICNDAKEQEKVVMIDGYNDVDSDEGALLCSVAKQPISVGISASSLDFQLYTGGIYDGDCSSNPSQIDHAVVIVGYGSSEEGVDYWIVKNSWGTSWGMEGYIYIRRNTELAYGVCGINAMASFPTKHSPSPSPFPQPFIPPPGPPPSQCGQWSYCLYDETCCCVLEMQGFCLVYGCCPSQNGVCCAGSSYCCSQEYPICDIQDGLCLQKNGDLVGIALGRPKLAKYKLPWTHLDEASKEYNQLLWKRGQLQVHAIA